MARSSARLCSAPWPPNGARCRCCRCLFDLVSLGFLIRAGHWPLGQLRQSGGLRYKHDAALGHVQRGHGGVSQIRAGHAARGRDRGPAAPVHPTFLYESIWCLVGFAVLASLYKNGGSTDKSSWAISSGTAWAAPGSRGLRTDSLLIGNTGLRASQLVAIGSVIVGRRAYGHRSAQCQGKAAHGAAGCEGPEKAGRGRGPLHAGHPARRHTHAEFVKATDAMNARLDALDLSEVEIEEIETPKE